MVMREVLQQAMNLFTAEAELNARCVDLTALLLSIEISIIIGCLFFSLSTEVVYNVEFKIKTNMLTFKGHEAFYF